MWIGPSVRSRFYSHQSARSENNYDEEEPADAFCWSGPPPPLPRRGGRGRGKPRANIGTRGGGRTGMRGAPRGRITSMRRINDNSGMNMNSMNYNSGIGIGYNAGCSYTYNSRGRGTVAQYYDQQNQGRGRGGLPNETTQNIRKSGYGYVGPTHALPRDVYRRFGGQSVPNDPAILSVQDNFNINRSSPSLGSYSNEEARYNYRTHPYGRTTQSKYRKKPAQKKVQLAPNEIRIRGTGGSIKQYVSYASSLLSPKPNKLHKRADDKTYELIKLTATGRAIGKAVNCVEVIKRKIYGLHQVTTLNTVTLSEIWEPLESGLREVTISTSISAIEIILTFDRDSIDCNAVGYQAPISWIDLGDAREYLNRIKSQNDKMRAMQIKYDNQTFQMRDIRNKYDVLSMQWRRNKTNQTLDYENQKGEYDTQGAVYDTDTQRYNKSLDLQDPGAQKETGSGTGTGTGTGTVTVTVTGTCTGTDDKKATFDPKSYKKYDAFDAQSAAYESQRVAYNKQRLAYNAQTGAYKQQSEAYVAQSRDMNEQTIEYGAQTVAYDAQTIAYGAQTVAYDAQKREMNKQTVAYDKQTLAYGAQTFAYDKQTVAYGAQKFAYDKQTREMDDVNIAYDKQTVAYDAQTREMDEQTIAYDRQTVNYGRQTVAYDAQTVAFDRQTREADEQRSKYGELKKDYDEMKDEKDKRNDKKSQRKKKYELWDAEGVTQFIINMNTEKYLKYKENLLSGLSEQGIDGTCLTEISKEDLYRLGVRNFKDKRDIYNGIVQFTQNSSPSPPMAVEEEKKEK